MNETYFHEVDWTGYKYASQRTDGTELRSGPDLGPYIKVRKTIFVSGRNVINVTSIIPP